MIAYEIQLRYVIGDKIQDKIQSRQNPVRDKIQPEKKPKKKILLLEKKIVRKNLSRMLSRISSA